MRQYLKLFICAVLLAFSGAARVYSAPLAADTGPQASSGVADTGPLIQLGPGDQITMNVFGRPEMDGSMNVADDGTIRVPLAGAVQVAGLSPSEAAQRVETALKQGQFLVDPHVTITVLTSRSQRVSVLGEVRTPGSYPIESNTTVFELLAQAGGETETGGNTVYVMRPGKDGHVTRYKVSLRGFSDADDALPTQTLQGGDSVYVPKADQFYISGEVQMPGTYKLDPGMTVLQAIARAGGITVRGSARRVELRRKEKDGKYEVLHPGASELVEPDDVLRVKESIF